MSVYSKAQEYRTRDVCRKHGLKAERVPLSGACHAIGKGDVIVEDGKLLLDAKSTRGKQSISIKKSDIEKIISQAGEGRGVLTFTYLQHPKIYAIIPLDDLLELIKLSWQIEKEIETDKT